MPTRKHTIAFAQDITLGRRSLLRSLAASGLLLAIGSTPWRNVLAQPRFDGTPFTLGVASGDPSPDGFVIWTRLAPRPLERGGGMPAAPVEVQWELARDAAMREVLATGSAVARPELAHAVHVEVGGLDAGRDYYYRFNAGGEASPVGRSKTLPAAGATLAELRFAAAGCQKYEDGLFTAWRRIAEERFDFVFHYGDYIYEYKTVRPGERPLPVVRVMPGEPGECIALEDYRHRYGLYKLDADLQAAHASAPFLMTFDDHEVDNNWAGEVPEDKQTRAQFLIRRAAAFQAWYEHMPLRRAQMPRGPDILAYRRLIAGDLLNINLLDTRQYRSDQPCGDGAKPNCAAALELDRTMLGEAQERWLYQGFHDVQSRWTLLAQQVPIMRLDRDADPSVYAPHMDKWDGAVAARDRLRAAVEQARLANLVVCTGDIHHHCAGELRRNFDDPRSPAWGTEFIGSSISSLGDGFDINARYKALMAQDPHVRLYNGQRGYVRHIVRRDRWQADYQVLDKVSTPDGRMRTRASFTVEHGRAGIAG